MADQYRLEALVAQGGMGAVWQATHLATGRLVAMKFLAGGADDRERLFREARTAGQVRHPGVVEILDAFLDEGAGRAVIVMELLTGETLATHLTRFGPLPLSAGAAILLDIIDAMAAAHAVGVVHRDLKPSNVFLVEAAGALRAKVVDFGLAKVPSDDAAHLTTTGRVLGTPPYMAPEQCYGLPDIDHRADIWAVGVLTHEVLTGDRPLAGRTVGRVLESLLTYGIPSLRMTIPDAPFSLVVAVRRALEPERDRRAGDFAELAAALQPLASRPPPR